MASFDLAMPQIANILFTLAYCPAITESSTSDAAFTLSATSSPARIFSIIGCMTSVSIWLPIVRFRCQSLPISDAFDTLERISFAWISGSSSTE